jgi:zinc transport system permease protein
LALDLLFYDFIQRAFIAGIIVSLVAPVIGVFMVLRRLSLIGDTLSHTAFAGVAIGAVLNIFPLWTALITTVLGATAITKIRRSTRVAGDAALALIFSLGLALGIVMLSLATNVSASLESLLFGSILLVSFNDLLLITVIGLVTLATVFLLYKDLFYVTVDEDLARVSGLPVDSLNYLLSILTAIIVVASIRIVGILLISLLLVIPVLAASQIARSFRQTIIFSVLLAVLSVIVGIMASLYAPVPPGGSIVLTAIAIFLISIPVGKLVRS